MDHIKLPAGCKLVHLVQYTCWLCHPMVQRNVAYSKSGHPLLSRSPCVVINLICSACRWPISCQLTLVTSSNTTVHLKYSLSGTMTTKAGRLLHYMRLWLQVYYLSLHQFMIGSAFGCRVQVGADDLQWWQTGVLFHINWPSSDLCMKQQIKERSNWSSLGTNNPSWTGHSDSLQPVQFTYGLSRSHSIPEHGNCMQ